MSKPEDPWGDLLVRVGDQKDARAFQSLFDHFAPRLKARLIKTGATASTAEDVVQESFITIWRKAASYDPAKASASTWIFTVTRNKHIDLIRRESRPEPDMNDPAFVQSDMPDASVETDARQRAALIRTAIDALPESQRTVLLRSYFDENSHSEIADSLQLPIGTVKSRIRLALEKLQAGLPQLFKDE